MNDVTDLTRLPTAADSATFVEAYREWQKPDGEDALMAAAMFACFPGNSLADDERCVTIDGFALVAQRACPGGDWVYDLEHYPLDGQVAVTAAR